MPEASNVKSPPAPIIGLVSWLVPGAGYWLLGMKARALTVGISIILLFLGGLLIGGIRSLEVPGYSPRGRPINVVYEGRSRDNKMIARTGDDVGGDWIMTSAQLMDEIRAKPWAIAQIMAGPMNLLCDMWAVHASVGADPGSGQPAEHPAVRSHSRTNEIGVLYTAVAGMLNLLAMIDATHRAGQTERK